MSRKLLTLVLLLVFTSGCAKLMGNLRRDLDDSDMDPAPTTGGVWPEAGYLSEETFPDKYNAVGHSERNPASNSFGGRDAGKSAWVSSEDRETNRRDRYRGRAEDDEGDEQAANSDGNSQPGAGTRKPYKNGMRATRNDFIDESQNEGSLWAADGQSNYFFSKNKIRGPGDIITVMFEDGLIRDAATELRRTLSPDEKEQELVAAQERINNKAMGISGSGDKAGDSISTSSAAAARTDGKDAKKVDPSDIPAATYSDIDVSQSMQLKAGDAMLAEVIERYPNGNYKVRGTKKVPYRGSTRLMSLVGIVKGSDISDDDKVPSGKLYEYRLESIR